MAPPSLITAAVIVTSVFTKALNGYPAWSAGQLPMLRETQYTCEPFRQPYCHCFSRTDRTHARFPNPRGQGAEEAQLEFAHFVRPSRNVIKNGCSDKIGTLLCFFYFPHCNAPTDELETADHRSTMMVQRLQSDDFSLPCRKLCEEVREDCESEFSESQVRWPEHFNCNTLPNSNCINGSDPVQGYDACVQPPTPNPTDIAQVPTENEPVCERFEQPYCQCFGPGDRTHALFPNPSNQYAEVAQREFIKYGSKVIDSGCSDKIGTLLCFFYFPHCNIPTDTLNSNTTTPHSLPCRELCEEVQRDCESEFNTTGFPWLNCSALPTVDCISGSRDPVQGYSGCVSTPTVQSPETPTIIDVPPEVDHACEPFDQPYCRCFNPNDRTHAVFPNHHNQSAREAEREFDHFVQPSGNVIKSSCSNKIGTLLCFFYFPPCNPPKDGNVNTAPTTTEFLPCRELCEEVRRDCEGEFIRNWRQQQWQDFYLNLDCSRLPSTACINSSDPRQGYDACVDDNRFNSIKPREPEPPVSTVPPCDPGRCPPCSLRRKCTGGTFVNNNYTWAARVRVLSINGSKNGKKIFLVQKEEQYLFYSMQPTLQDIEVIHTTNPECCNNCPGDIVVGGIYLFSGAYNTNTLEWYLEVKNRGSLISEWSQRYETDLAAWIARGVASRSREK